MTPTPIPAEGILIRALEWYANPKHWSEDDWGVQGLVDPPEYGDPGKKARRALKRYKRAVNDE